MLKHKVECERSSIWENNSWVLSRLEKDTKSSDSGNSKPKCKWQIRSKSFELCGHEGEKLGGNALVSKDFIDSIWDACMHVFIP